MPDSVRENGAGEIRRYSPIHSYASYKQRERMVTIRLLVSEAESLSEILNAISRSHIPNPERWKLVADIAHDLDLKLAQIKNRMDPK